MFFWFTIYNMRKKLLIFLLLFLLFGIGIVTGFLIGKFNVVAPSTPSQPPLAFTERAKNPLLQEVFATIRGKITQADLNKKTITFVDERQISGDIVLSDKLLINEIPEGKEVVGTPSSDLKKIKLNKDCVITLREINNTFQVVSISYLPNSLVITEKKATQVNP